MANTPVSQMLTYATDVPPPIERLGRPERTIDFTPVTLVILSYSESPTTNGTAYAPTNEYPVFKTKSRRPQDSGGTCRQLDLSSVS